MTKIDYRYLKHDITMLLFDTFETTIKMSDNFADKVLEKLNDFNQLPDSLPTKLTYCRTGKHLFPMVDRAIDQTNHLKRFCKEHFFEENVYTDIWNHKELFEILKLIGDETEGID